MRTIRETKEEGKNNVSTMLINNISYTIINTNMIITKMVMDN